ncbi:MAG: IS1 family transposase, partial [Chloroflexota bacterium]|nr:IS1 family transposase [Chloroflexota bacterium]
GATAHMERWYNTLRQRLARFVRKTWSFSKSDAYHNMVTKWYIAEYHLPLNHHPIFNHAQGPNAYYLVD